MLAQINAAQAEEMEASGKTSARNPNKRIGDSWRANGNQTRVYLLGWSPICQESREILDRIKLVTEPPEVE